LSAWGIERGYHDVGGTWHDAPDATIEAVAAALGASEQAPVIGDDVWVVRAGDRVDAGGLYTLTFEDGGQARGDGALPPDIPLGYHNLFLHQRGRVVRLIVSPHSCHRLLDPMWGWAVQLYALRSAGSWGIGDLADLRELARWSAGLGAKTALINPLHAALPGDPQQPSPYYPSSRCFRNPVYLRVEDVAGAGAVADVGRLAAAGRALAGDRRVDRDAVWRLKEAALQAIFDRFEASGGDRAFIHWRREEGPTLDGYATFCALTEVHGRGWRSWPEGVRRPDSHGIDAFLSHPDNDRRVRFHTWLQWLLHEQLAAAGDQGVGLLQDLAIGCDPAGADAWLWQESFALDMRVGAPPDEFNQAGQDWGLPPFDPWRLRAAAFEPFVQTLRGGFRHGGGLRFDHVMGLFRLFWIPEGAGPAEGTYVRYPWMELLDVLALESHRAGAFVVGEDLGTVEPWVREELAHRGVLSYRVLWFEPTPPKDYPEQALAAVTTHDLPTVAGLWTGADLDEQRACGLEPNVASTRASRDRLAAWAGLPDDAPVEEAILGAHRLLAAAPSLVVAASLEDVLGVQERPNLPGTTDERPNWSLALPRPLEAIFEDPRCREVAELLDLGRETAGSTFRRETSPLEP
jgi:4-alpha-glucanotransferase